jgi:hypothetical protein
MLHHAVEQVAVGDPQPTAVSRDVDAFVHHVDAAEVVFHVAARELVVVAGHEHHTRALARLAQDLLDDVVVRLRPEPLAPQLPAVDDVAHQVQRLAFQVTQKVEQRLGPAAGRAEVHVGYPGRAHLHMGRPDGPLGVIVPGHGVIVASHGHSSCAVRATVS